MSFSFSSRTELALKNINLNIDRGEFVVITGPSGCGKSTLAAAMAGFIPQGILGNLWGEIKINGQPTRRAALPSLATRASLCQQDPEAQLCTLSVRDEVAFGPENLGLPAPEVADRIQESLRAMNCLHLRDRSITELSGGEKQKIAIAAMLAMRRDVIILDEPTSSLDPESAEEVLSAIEAIHRERNTTVVVIEHRITRLLEIADRLIVMEAGRIVMDGNPCNVYERYKNSLGCPAQRGALGPIKRTAAAGDEIIDVRGLQFFYQNTQVLNDVSFTARKGELIGIIGPNGSGKTTFLHCLAGLCKPASGSVRVNGINVAKAPVSEMARNIGYIFQNPNHQIFENTVYDEVMFASRNMRISSGNAAPRCQAAMEEHGILQYAQNSPLTLSYGEKRRLNICAIIPHDPGIIVLDEPFVGQDESNAERIMGDLVRLRDAGKTVLIVAHEMNIVFRTCDRIVFFRAGSILVDDTPSKAIDKIKDLRADHYLPGSCRDDHQIH